jgi:hypothetical protein
VNTSPPDEAAEEVSLDLGMNALTIPWRRYHSQCIGAEMKKA